MHTSEEVWSVPWGQPRLPSQDNEVSAHSNLWGSPVFIQHSLTQNDQIRHGNTYGDGRVFRSAAPLHLHKCVARFVSDNWVSYSERKKILDGD